MSNDNPKAFIHACLPTIRRALAEIDARCHFVIGEEVANLRGSAGPLTNEVLAWLAKKQHIEALLVSLEKEAQRIFKEEAGPTI